jgi:beta-carotene 3-hydroxylase
LIGAAFRASSRLCLRGDRLLLYRLAMEMIWSGLIFVGALAGMEAFAWVTHRYVLHGPLWVLHRSHHEPRQGLFELNDLFVVIFALPAMGLLWWGDQGHAWATAAGLGVTAYGAIYALFHDGLVHGRFPTPLKSRSRFWRQRVQAHRLHHAVHTRTGAVSFGFLWAPSPRVLKARLARMRSAVASDGRVSGSRP